MKDLSISKKLIIGFGIVLFLLVLSAGLALYSIGIIGEQVNLYGEYTVPNTEYSAGMEVHMQANLYNLTYAIVAGDAESSKAALDLATGHGKEFVANRQA
ncbi:MAG TPA: hypothetical protein PLV37_04415, partial [Bacillota bacterium]|nr:hypothetical protein [Bacillota bacterium]